MVHPKLRFATGLKVTESDIEDLRCEDPVVKAAETIHHLDAKSLSGPFNGEVIVRGEYPWARLAGLPRGKKPLHHKPVFPELRFGWEDILGVRPPRRVEESGPNQGTPQCRPGTREFAAPPPPTQARPFF
jgi:hypothetical protein